ncbi:hypothetical protein NKJ35_13365 [Mesorhizobium sp. M0136]|uniref:hypothetical protein n=1 Tax=Mesorhizobium sp. M0136 TaxID=2956890 RepID=UPI00333A2FB1
MCLVQHQTLLSEKKLRRRPWCGCRIRPFQLHRSGPDCARLIWIKGQLEAERLYLAGGLAAAMYGAFFAAMLSRPIYGGVLYDENGYLPFRPPFGPAGWRWDVNVTVFTAMSAILLLGVAAI